MILHPVHKSSLGVPGGPLVRHAYWYRFEDYRTAHYDPLAWEEWGTTLSSGESSAAIRLLTYRVVRETPKGVWLIEAIAMAGWCATPRFVLRDARKRFACPTLQEARESWQARKARQEAIHTARLRHIQEARVIMERMQSGRYEG